MVLLLWITFLFITLSETNAEYKSDKNDKSDHILSVVLSELDQLRRSNELMDKKVSALERQLRENRKEYESELKRKSKEIAQLQLRLQTSLVSQSYRRERQINGGPSVAFTAYLSGHASNLGHQHTIPFDSVILNEGQAFNPNTHEFTCPVTGVYTFQTALMSQANTISITEIVKEGVQLVHAHAEARAAGTYFDQGFNSVVTKCNKGESVWVRNFKHFGTDVYSERYTTFTGFLLWETEEVNPGVVG